jgi:hypothetical protein
MREMATIRANGAENLARNADRPLSKSQSLCGMLAAVVEGGA